ncbi:secreted RxLR effector protein 161-like [Nicotiana tabacum]|uniref:Secreted RxLR effector protein 161-like n=1 Tax=Nicotiana tabacum TaxID=4097 RepID=A0AC58UI34_TOBAC
MANPICKLAWPKALEGLREEKIGYQHLGLEVFYKDDGVIISQRKFTLDLLKEYQCMDHISFNSPMDPTVKLKAKEGETLTEPTYYIKLIGKFNFLTNTRLDIDYSVQHLSQFVDDPREPYLKAVFHLLRYLKRDPTLGIFLSKDQDYTIRAYCDSDWATCPDSRKSVLMGSSPVIWKSKKQDTISLSSVEAEYRALSNIVGELVWLSRLFEELTSPFPKPIAVFVAVSLPCT